jgi:hypothetical protein
MSSISCTSSGDECGHSEEEFGCEVVTSIESVGQSYVHGWAVMPRLREELALSNLLSRLETASAKNVPPAVIFVRVCPLTPLTERRPHRRFAEVHFLRAQERRQHLRTGQQHPVCLTRAVCG